MTRRLWTVGAVLGAILGGAILERPALADVAEPGELQDGRRRLQKMHEYFERNTDVEYRTKMQQFDQATGARLSLTAHVRARQPNLFNVSVKAPRSTLLFISDGKTITAVNTGTKRYAEFLARPSLIGSMNVVTTMMAQEARVFDFFLTAKYASGEDGMRVLKKLPAKTIGKRTCEGFVVQRDDSQWEVWLDGAASDMPCRLTSIRRDGSALVMQTNDFEWTRTPSFPDSIFVSRPPAGARLVDASQLR